jgi:hypothetical protein
VEVQLVGLVGNSAQVIPETVLTLRLSGVADFGTSLCS